MTLRKTAKQHNREPRSQIRGSRIHGKTSRSRSAQRRFYFGRRKINKKRLLLFLLLVSVFFYGMISLIGFAARSAMVKKTNAELQGLYEAAAAPTVPVEQAAVIEPVTTAAPETENLQTPAPRLLSAYQYMGQALLPEAEKMRAINGDMVAWLHIPGGIVNLPVVYRDNTYYLDHDFNGKSSKGGTLFLDEAHPFREDTQYLVIHGHNMHDGSMFGTLAHYRKPGYMEAHPIVYLDTLYRQETYQVIGVLQLPASNQRADYVPFTGMPAFENVDQFTAFAQSIRSRALYWKEGAEMLPTDALMALSTCYGDERIVVMCKRISP